MKLHRIKSIRNTEHEQVERAKQWKSTPTKVKNRAEARTHRTTILLACLHGLKCIQGIKALQQF